MKLMRVSEYKNLYRNYIYKKKNKHQHAFQCLQGAQH